MTSRTVTKANCVRLSRINELYYDDANAYAPFTQCPASRLADELDQYAEPAVTVFFRTHGTDQEQSRDFRTYTRRLAKLAPRYTATTFVNRVVDGHTFPTQFVCTLTRT